MDIFEECLVRVVNAVIGLARRVAITFADRLEPTRVRLKWLSFLGAICFPLFWLVWKFIFPQPYENLGLRLGGFAMCALLYAAESRRTLLGRAHNAYAYATITLCLPFFFTFMMLANEANAIWLGSALCAILYLTLLLDPINLVVSFTIGTGLAIGVHLVTGDGSLPPAYIPSLPVFAFALAGGVGLNLSGELIAARAQIQAVKTVGSSIAHEVRTPLLGIRLDIENIQATLPTLLAAHDWAVDGGWDGDSLSRSQSVGLARALERVQKHTDTANTVVNMLLLNIGEQQVDGSRFAQHSMADVVEQALDTYPFKGGERAAVVWSREAGTDFTFFGSDLLMRHVLFNLLKNALRALAEADNDLGPATEPRTVAIRLMPGSDGNHVVVRDSGIGIPANRLEAIFQPFVTGRSDGTRVGIGLAFTARVIDSFGGHISCRSEVGRYTEFDIVLPPVTLPQEA